MAKRSKKVAWWLSGAITLLFIAGWLLLFVKPTLPIPKFLSQAPVIHTATSYYEGVHTVVRGGHTRNIPETTVTERITIRSPQTFEALLQAAEEELTAERGWDLGALPKEKVARFYQKTTNISVSLYLEKGEVRAALAQTRFATMADRLRHWFGKL
jgi:hypothetical protein